MDTILPYVFLLMLVISKAKLRSNQILRCFHSKDRDILSKAFVLYVRPIIESELTMGQWVMGHGSTTLGGSRWSRAVPLTH